MISLIYIRINEFKLEKKMMIKIKIILITLGIRKEKINNNNNKLNLIKDILKLNFKKIYINN